MLYTYWRNNKLWRRIYYCGGLTVADDVSSLRKFKERNSLPLLVNTVK